MAKRLRRARRGTGRFVLALTCGLLASGCGPRRTGVYEFPLERGRLRVESWDHDPVDTLRSLRILWLPEAGGKEFVTEVWSCFDRRWQPVVLAREPLTFTLGGWCFTRVAPAQPTWVLGDRPGSREWQPCAAVPAQSGRTVVDTTTKRSPSKA